MLGKNENLEDDLEDYLRFMVNLIEKIYQFDYIYFLKDKKFIWKDHVSKEEDHLANGANLIPLYSITSSHFWIRRNLIPISDGNFLILLFLLLIISR